MKTLFKCIPSGALYFADGVAGEVGLTIFLVPAAMKRQNPSVRYVDADGEPVSMESCSDAPDVAHRYFRRGFWFKSLPASAEPASDVPDVPADLQEQSLEWDRLGAYPQTASTIGEPLKVDSSGNSIVIALSPEEAAQQHQQPPKPRVDNIDGQWYLDGVECVTEPTPEAIAMSQALEPWEAIARMHGEQTLREAAERRRKAEQSVNGAGTVQAPSSNSSSPVPE